MKQAMTTFRGMAELRFRISFDLQRQPGLYKCPDRIQRQVLKNSYEMGGLKAPDMAALNSALKVKQFINATKSKI